MTTIQWILLCNTIWICIITVAIGWLYGKLVKKQDKGYCIKNGVRGGQNSLRLREAEKRMDGLDNVVENNRLVSAYAKAQIGCIQEQIIPLQAQITPLEAQMGCLEAGGHVWLYNDNIFNQAVKDKKHIDGAEYTIITPKYQYRCPGCGKIKEFTWDELDKKQQDALKVMKIGEEKKETKEISKDEKQSKESSNVVKKVMDNIEAFVQPQINQINKINKKIKAIEKKIQDNYLIINTVQRRNICLMSGGHYWEFVKGLSKISWKDSDGQSRSIAESTLFCCMRCGEYKAFPYKETKPEKGKENDE